MKPIQIGDILGRMTYKKSAATSAKGEMKTKVGLSDAILLSSSTKLLMVYGI